MNERREASGPDARPGAGQRSAERRVRFTLDLARSQHRFLKQFALDAEADASVVLRALLDVLEDDERLAETLRKRIERR